MVAYWSGDGDFSATLYVCSQHTKPELSTTNASGYDVRTSQLMIGFSVVRVKLKKKIPVRAWTLPELSRRLALQNLKIICTLRR
jgi:hypothetical protein